MLLLPQVSQKPKYTDQDVHHLGYKWTNGSISLIFHAFSSKVNQNIIKIIISNPQAFPMQSCPRSQSSCFTLASCRPDVQSCIPLLPA